MRLLIIVVLINITLFIDICWLDASRLLIQLKLPRKKYTAPFISLFISRARFAQNSAEIKETLATTCSEVNKYEFCSDFHTNNRKIYVLGFITFNHLWRCIVYDQGIQYEYQISATMIAADKVNWATVTKPGCLTRHFFAMDNTLALE